MRRRVEVSLRMLEQKRVSHLLLVSDLLRRDDSRKIWLHSITFAPSRKVRVSHSMLGFTLVGTGSQGVRLRKKKGHNVSLETFVLQEERNKPCPLVISEKYHHPAPIVKPKNVLSNAEPFEPMPSGLEWSLKDLCFRIAFLSRHWCVRIVDMFGCLSILKIYSNNASVTALVLFVEFRSAFAAL